MFPRGIIFLTEFNLLQVSVSSDSFKRRGQGTVNASLLIPAIFHSQPVISSGRLHLMFCDCKAGPGLVFEHDLLSGVLFA